VQRHVVLSRNWPWGFVTGNFVTGLVDFQGLFPDTRRDVRERWRRCGSEFGEQFIGLALVAGVTACHEVVLPVSPLVSARLDVVERGAERVGFRNIFRHANAAVRAAEIVALEDGVTGAFAGHRDAEGIVGGRGDQAGCGDSGSRTGAGCSTGLRWVVPEEFHRRKNGGPSDAPRHARCNRTSGSEASPDSRRLRAGYTLMLGGAVFGCASFRQPPQHAIQRGSQMGARRRSLLGQRDDADSTVLIGHRAGDVTLLFQAIEIIRNVLT
jgi:hypothetical protein